MADIFERIYLKAPERFFHAGQHYQQDFDAACDAFRQALRARCPDLENDYLRLWHELGQDLTRRDAASFAEGVRVGAGLALDLLEGRTDTRITIK